MANLTDADVNEATGLPMVAANDVVPDTAFFFVTIAGVTKGIALPILKALLNITPALPQPAANTFDNFSDTDAGGSVVVVPATGVPITDYLYKIGANGPDVPVSPTGIISVGNVADSVFTYAKATASRAQSPVAVSPAFTAYLGSSSTTPPAPTFDNFSDTDAGGTIRLVPAAGLTPSDYVYRIAAGRSEDPYVAVPADGIIVAGNVTGRVFAYSIAVTGRNQSQTGVSQQSFTAYNAGTTPDPGITTPTYVGLSATPTPSDAAVQAMPSFLWTKQARQLHFACNNTYPTFAEPASYGLRSIVQDKNGFNITGDIARTTTNLVVGGVSTPYNVYTHQNPQFDTDFVENI